VNDSQALGGILRGVDKKVTPELAQHLANAHADGVSFRTLGKLYDLAPSLVHRHVTRVNAAAPGAEPEPTAPDVEPGSGAPEPQPFPQPPSPARPRPPELEFPETVPGFEPEPDEHDLDADELPPLPPKLAPGQHPKSNVHPLEWAEHNVKTAAMDIAQARKADLPDKLAEYEEKRDELRDFIETYADAYAGLSFYRPTAYETGVRVSEQFVSDRRPRALWENPHDHGPRGFTIVGQ
jgi:hypothetical protein